MAIVYTLSFEDLREGTWMFGSPATIGTQTKVRWLAVIILASTALPLLGCTNAAVAPTPPPASESGTPIPGETSSSQPTQASGSSFGSGDGKELCLFSIAEIQSRFGALGTFERTEASEPRNLNNDGSPQDLACSYDGSLVSPATSVDVTIGSYRDDLDPENSYATPHDAYEEICDRVMSDAKYAPASDCYSLPSGREVVLEPGTVRLFVAGDYWYGVEVFGYVDPSDDAMHRLREIVKDLDKRVP
ncbi:MAG: hypothetical protein K4304_10065 [Propionicimonas sp.]